MLSLVDASSTQASACKMHPRHEPIPALGQRNHNCLSPVAVAACCCKWGERVSTNVQQKWEGLVRLEACLTTNCMLQTNASQLPSKVHAGECPEALEHSDVKYVVAMYMCSNRFAQHSGLDTVDCYCSHPRHDQQMCHTCVHRSVSN